MGKRRILCRLGFAIWKFFAKMIKITVAIDQYAALWDVIGVDDCEGSVSSCDIGIWSVNYELLRSSAVPLGGMDAGIGTYVA